MLSRIAAGSLALLILALWLLAHFAPPLKARIAAPLTPPPIVSQVARPGPILNRPAATTALTGTVTPTATVALTGTLLLTPTPALTFTPEATSTVTTTISATTTPTAATDLLPTVTPTPPLVLLPTLTPTPTPTTVLTTVLTSVPTTTVQAILPTATASAMPPAHANVSPTVATTSAITQAMGELPTPSSTASVPFPASYVAQGTFASQTVYTDTSVAEQEGSFTIVQAAAANLYGANQQYTLRTERAPATPAGRTAEGLVDEINVYQVDNYIAVSYTGGEWMLVRRDQGSNVVRAIQPLTDLALLFPRVIAEAEFIGQEEIAGASSLRYRIHDPAGQGARLIQSLLALSGEIRALQLDVWIAVPGGYVVAYDFEVKLASARVLDALGNEVRANQAVTWTFALTPEDEPQRITWPDGAPLPDAFPVPGFADGTFPIPAETELLTFVGGVPELISALTAVEVDTFYRAELFALGWTVEGRGGLLRCSKAGTSFQMLIIENATGGGTRISILPGEP